MNHLTGKVLARREFFGATLFDVITGHRVYVNENEFLELKEHSFISEVLGKELGIASQGCLIIEPEWLPEFNFSAPNTVFFELTRACNVRCLHCFNNSGINLNDELSCEEKNKIINDLWQTGVQEIRFTGGEPLMSQEICDLLSFSANLGLRNSIGTNATLVTKAFSKHLADVGLHLAVVSIDGTEIVHDRIRGQGSFAKAMQGISLLRSCGIFIRVNTVVMRSNLKELVLLVEYFFKQEIPLFLRRFIPGGRSSSYINEMLTADEYIVLKNTLAPYLEDNRNLIQGHYLHEHEAKTRIKLPFTHQKCSAGSRGLVILPNGKVQTCGFLGPLGERHIGRVPKERMHIIWKRLLTSGYVNLLRNNLAEYNAQTSGLCTNCFAIAIATKNKTF